MSKTIIITGTRKGIGKALAEHFIALGYIVGGCSRKPASISHSNYIHYSLDVSDELSVIEMTKDFVKRYSTIDVLINNAGIASMNHICLTPLKSAINIINTNFIGTFIFTREISKIMLKQNLGRIINFSSVAVPLQLDGEAIYASSKAAVESFTKISAKELSKFNITVNAIGPTAIKTDLIKNLSDDKINSLLDRQAIQRLATVNDVINVIEFFINDNSSLVTGQVIYLGGVRD